MHRTTGIRFFAAAMLLFAFVTPLAGQAEPPGQGYKDRFEFFIGGFWPSTNTRIRLDARDGSAGTDISLEDDLGVSDNVATPTAGFKWRIAGGHGLRVGYFNLSRDGATTLTGEIQVEDEIYEINENVESGLDTEILYVDYAYDFFGKRPRSTFGIAAGFHVTRADFFIRSRDRDLQTSADTTAPLPVIGLFGSSAFGERWAFMGLGQLFALKFDDYEGRLVNLWAEFQYNPFKHVGFGFGWSYFGVDLDAEKTDFTGKVEWNYTGPMLTIRFYF